MTTPHRVVLPDAVDGPFDTLDEAEAAAAALGATVLLHVRVPRVAGADQAAMLGRNVAIIVETVDPPLPGNTVAVAPGQAFVDGQPAAIVDMAPTGIVPFDQQRPIPPGTVVHMHIPPGVHPRFPDGFDGDITVGAREAWL